MTKGRGGGSNAKLKGVLILKICNLQSKAWPTLLQRCMDTLDIPPPPPQLPPQIPSISPEISLHG